MKLVGVMRGQEYHPARGVHNGVPYRIVQEGSRFVLHAQIGITVVASMLACPVGVFDDEWQGVYSWDANDQISGGR